jgi:two-component system nitrogen regulation response regulator NtrX
VKTAGDILIVDDERDIRSLIAATLRDEGFATMEAASAGEARDLMAAKPPGLAILDIWMRDSDMDGLELLEWVKGYLPGIACRDDIRPWHGRNCGPGHSQRCL